MPELDLEHLLGGFATNTLTEAEHQALFRAAMANQRLFDLLADEQALRELLDDPSVRRRLLEKLKEPAAAPQVDWVRRVFGWLVRPETLTVAGSLAVLAVATVLGLQLWEESQLIRRAEESAPPLSQIIKEPTVRSKLGAKPAPPSAASQEPAEQPGRTQERGADAPATTRPEPPPQGQADDVHAAPPLGLKPAPQSPPASAERDRRSQPAEVNARTMTPPLGDLEGAEDLPPAPAQLPPVVLPRVPAKTAQSKGIEADEAAAVSQEETPPLGGAATPPLAEGLDPPPPAGPESVPFQEPEPSLEMEPESVIAVGPPRSPAAAETPLPAPFVDHLKRPAVGSARALFFGPLDSKSTASENASDGGTARESKPEALERREPLGGLPSASEGAVQAERSAEAAATDAAGTAEVPLAIRFHRRHLPLQGSGPQRPTDGLAIPQITIEVNQRGYLYVMTKDASGWTVLSPAGTTRHDGTPTPVATQRITPYQVILMGKTTERASLPTYIVLSRAPEPVLDHALALASAQEQAASAARELDALLVPWIQHFGAQSLKTEQVAEKHAGGKSVQITYVADAAVPPKSALLYRLPPMP